MNSPSALKLSRVFDAPRAEVFHCWTDSDELAAWFAPDGFSVTSSAMQPRVGGPWRVEFSSPAGETVVEHGVVIELVAPSRLVLTHIVEHPAGTVVANTRVTVELVELAASRTEMHFEQAGLPSEQLRTDMAGGWNECFRQLEERLAR